MRPLHACLLASTAAALPVLTTRSPLPALASEDSASFYGSIVGPVVASDFPDPAVLSHAGTSYAYSTSSGGIHIPMATSTDNNTWSLLSGHDALPVLAPWMTSKAIWAPDVVLIDSTFVMYFASATVATNGKYHCIGVATSSDPLGPFTPSPEPLICPDGPSTGGAIDPDGFYDDASGKRYVAYKIDGNALGNGGACNNGVAPLKSTPIMLQEVSADGLSLVGAPSQILDRDDSDGPLVEAPSLHRSEEGVYFLFFASNCYSSPYYATSYATSGDVRGPYVKAGRPLLVTGDGPDVVGPGGLDVVNGGGLIGFHGIQGARAPAVKSEGEGEVQQSGPLVRGMYAGRAVFEGQSVSFQLDA
jgi:beta-xylosidase